MDALDNVLKIEERLVAKATQYRMPIGGTFELLPLCNMNCKMCYIRLNQKEMNALGRLRSYEEWLEIAQEMKKEGTLFVLLTGGEPFLYPHFKELYLGLKKLGMIITINTNGTLINEEWAEFLSKDKPRRVNVTLYGASNETYEKLCHHPFGFDQTIKGIEYLKKYQIDVKLNGTLVPENCHELDSLIELSKQLDLYLKIDTYMFPSSRKKIHSSRPQSRLNAQDAAKYCLEIKSKTLSNQSFNDYKNRMLNYKNIENTPLDSLNCRAAKSSFWITWDGYITPCVFMDEPSINVFSIGFKAAWEQLCILGKELSLPSECITCDKRSICQICGACAYCENGHLNDKPLYMCEYTTTLLSELEKQK